jgi:hypothetical protein
MKLDNLDELADYLVREWNYVPVRAPETAEKLLSLGSEIRNAFKIWFKSGEFSDTPVYSGLSPKSLNRLVHLKPPAIFPLLDWIRRDPNEAMRAIQEELITKQQEPYI